MQEFRVILTWEAIYDIVDISEYIEEEFNKERADKFEKDIKRENANLGHLRGAFGNTQLYYRGYSIHKKPFSPSIIFYIVKEEKREVHILRVLREERDWKRILSEQTNYSYPEN